MTARPALPITEGPSYSIDTRYLAPSATAVQALRRARFDPVSLQELADSFVDVGLLEPLLVRPLADKRDGCSFEIVAGERRWRAAQLAGLATVPVITRELTDAQVLRVQMIENIQREDLSPLEEGTGYRELMTAESIDAATLGKSLGKSRSYIYSRTKLLDLAPVVRDQLATGEIDASKALLLARLPAKLQVKALSLYESRESSSYLNFAHTLKRNLITSLERAPFGLDDDTLERTIKIGRREDTLLVPACSACIHNTDLDRDLAAVYTTPHCLDPECYAGKVACHTAHTLNAHRNAGRTVLTGDDARRAVPDQYSQGYNDQWLDLDAESGADFPEAEPNDQDSDAWEAWNNAYEDWEEPTFRTIIGATLDDHADSVVLADLGKNGIKHLLPVKLAIKLLKPHHIKITIGDNPLTPGGADNDDDRHNLAATAEAREAEAKERAREEARMRLELEYRKRLFLAIAAKWKGDLKRDELLDIAQSRCENVYGDGSELLYAAMAGKPAGDDDDSEIELSKLKDPDLVKLLALSTIVESATYSSGKPGPLLAMAQRFRIDPKKIKAEATAAVKAAAKDKEDE